MSDFAKNVVMQLKPDYVAICLLEKYEKSSYVEVIEDKLLHGLKCKDIDFYKKIIRTQFKQIRSAEKAYKLENDGKIKFTSDHHYHFILARHIIRPLFYNEIGAYLKIYRDMKMFDGNAKSTKPTYTKPEPVYIKPLPSPIISKETDNKPVYIKPLPSPIISKETDNKPVIMISTVIKSMFYNMYCMI